MYKRTIELTSVEGLKQQRQKLDAELAKAGVSDQSKELLREQVLTTFDQFEMQLNSAAMKRLKSDRVFEGIDYKVLIKARFGAASFSEKIRTLLGLG
jgi:hypothetical protein